MPQTVTTEFAILPPAQLPTLFAGANRSSTLPSTLAGKEFVLTPPTESTLFLVLFAPQSLAKQFSATTTLDNVNTQIFQFLLRPPLTSAKTPFATLPLTTLTFGFSLQHVTPQTLAKPAAVLAQLVLSPTSVTHPILALTGLVLPEFARQRLALLSEPSLTEL